MPQLWISGRIPSKKNSKRIVMVNRKPRLLSSKDYPNAVEGVNDALVLAGVLVDDKWQVTGNVNLTGQLANSKAEAGVLVTFKVAEYE